MITQAIFAVLITKALSGAFTVTETPSMHACDEARCVALYSETCADHAAHLAAAQKFRDTIDADWVAAHPKEVAACARKEGAKPDAALHYPCDSEVTVNLSIRGIYLFQPEQTQRGVSWLNPRGNINAWCAK